MPHLTIEPLRQRHVPDAAALVAERYAALRGTVPVLPSRYAELAELIPRLHDLVDRAPGAVALRGGQLVGFLGAYLVDNFRGRRGVFSPEWANGAELAASRPIYEALYAHMAAVWQADARIFHGASLFANDAAGREALHWLGFGLGGGDAIRDLAPIDAGPTGLTIARAGLADLPRLAPLDDGLHLHLMAPPVSLRLDPPGDHSELAEHLEDPAFAFWCAWDGERPVAFIKFGPATHTACTIIVDPGTTSITGAFTEPAYRGRGLGAALLERGLAWARAEGYERCSVDFETMNTPAARFWLSSFNLICLANLRVI